MSFQLRYTSIILKVEVKQMVAFLIENISEVVGGHVFQQSVGIPMGTSFVSLLADHILYSYDYFAVYSKTST
jgi:hypothetical protein